MPFSSPYRPHLLAAATLLCLAAVPPFALKSHAQTIASASRLSKTTPWEQAERAREDLEALPPAARTRSSYARVMDSFRAVYHDDPSDLHAAASVYAVAELLAEQGRGLATLRSPDATRTLQAAVGQYEFLRTQYPGSSLRVAALLAEAQLEENDLHDLTAARERYRLLLKQYPRSEQSEEARAGLDSIASGRSRTANLAQTQTRSPAPSSASPVDATIVGDPVNPASPDREEPGAAEPDRQARLKAATAAARKPAPPNQTLRAQAPPAPTPPALVKSIRHWSTPTYTRVAIDLGDDVTFEAARVPNPDRIYFDLHNTHLAPELVGKSFSVTDDGFLRKIRAAQFSGNMTRIVLDVNDVSEYSAFLLPNPYRLIIDIHGGASPAPAATAPLASAAARPSALPQSASSQSASSPTSAPQPASSQPASQSPAPIVRSPASSTASTLPSIAPTSAAYPTSITPPPASTFTRSAPNPRAIPNSIAVPNTVAVRAASSTDVASLSAQPGRVDATTRPTSQPIAAVVANHAVPSHAVSNRAPADHIPSARSRPASKATPPAKTNEDTADITADPDALATRAAKSAGAAAPPRAAPSRAAAPTAQGETSLTRALGLKIGRIVLDPGHGGHDSGTLGVDGIEEKDVVLDVALRLGKLLQARLGAEVVYTRSDDTFIPLETRTAIANKAQADLFLSIHANSSPDQSARGVETYYLNFTSSPDALETAARENAVSNQSIHQLSDLVKKITLRDKIDESREFATDVQQGLYTGLAKGRAFNDSALQKSAARLNGPDLKPDPSQKPDSALKDRGVKKAPFVVLIGANMPSILAEISFVTNPRDAALLRQPDYRQRVAESLYSGIARYESGLSGGKPPTLHAAAKPSF